MLMDYARFIVGFIIFLFALVLIVYPIDSFFPFFSNIIPFLKDISLLDYAQKHSSFLYLIIGGSGLLFVTYKIVSS